MDETIRQDLLSKARVARGAVQTVIDALDAQAPAAYAWHVGDVAVAVANPLQLYDAAHNASGKPRPDYSSDQNVLAVSPDGQWLKVFASPEYWVRSADVKLKGT